MQTQTLSVFPLLLFLIVVQAESWLRNTLFWGRGLSSLGLGYKNTWFLTDNGDLPYEIIGFSKSGSLLEFLSTRALPYIKLIKVIIL